MSPPTLCRRRSRTASRTVAHSTSCSRGCCQPSWAPSRRRTCAMAPFRLFHPTRGLNRRDFASRTVAGLARGWIHLAATDADAQAVLGLLSPQGQMFRAILRLTSETAYQYEVGFDKLPVGARAPAVASCRCRISANQASAMHWRWWRVPSWRRSRFWRRGTPQRCRRSSGRNGLSAMVWAWAHRRRLQPCSACACSCVCFTIQVYAATRSFFMLMRHCAPSLQVHCS